MFVTGRPPTTAQWPLQGSRAGQNPSRRLAGRQVCTPAPSQSGKRATPRLLHSKERATRRLTPRGAERAKPRRLASERGSVPTEGASFHSKGACRNRRLTPRGAERARPRRLASERGSVPTEGASLHSKGSVPDRRPSARGARRKTRRPNEVALATSSAFRGEVCGREDLAPRAPRAGLAPKTAIGSAPKR